MKVCSRCQSTKPLNEFYVRKSGARAGEVLSACAECYKKANLLKDRELVRKWCRESKSRWRKKNPEEAKKRLREFYAKDPKRYRKQCREWARNKALKKLGLTRSDFEYMMNSQQEKCAICLKKFQKHRGACVDHCHSSGKVRELLCHNCNLGLGHFKDSVASLRQAIQYLQKHE